MTKKFSADRFENLSAPAHDDMLGVLVTGIAGANQWNVKDIRDSGIPLGFLRNNSNDYASIRIQSPHWRKQATNLDSIHIHYITDSIITAGQTISLTVYWTWLHPGDPVPALSSWTSTTESWVIASELPAWYYGAHSVVTSPAPPSTDGYGMYLLCRIVRGNGTWTGELGILDMDAHAPKDRLGSNYEISDSA